MAFSELIKNFNHIRAYMRDFLVYGFKTRTEYDRKSARSYDNERRRIQNYLGDLVSFKTTPAGRNVFISLDGRTATHNPLYRAFKSKSFTDKDITLHFILMDILSGKEAYTLNQLSDAIDEQYLYTFDDPISYDESTLRKKLKEYVSLGLVETGKDGRQATYRITKSSLDIKPLQEAVRFYSEENPLGVIGSYVEDRMEAPPDPFIFKNHFIMNAYDAEIIETVLQGIHEHCHIEISNYSRRDGQVKIWKVIPLKLYVSVQDGRNYLMCRHHRRTEFLSYRIDYIREAKLSDPIKDYEKHQQAFVQAARHIWGVVCSRDGKLQHVEMDIHVEEGEEYIIKRLIRERRGGDVRRIAPETYRFEADVFSAYEMVPWLRSFIGRIVGLKCDDPEVVSRIREDMMLLAERYEVSL